MELECKSWGNKGKNVKYEVRNTRKGYKAGALKEGLLRDYVQQCNYVAIFDADFQPEPDFLLRTIPYLVRNPQIGLVQAHWEFGKLEKHSNLPYLGSLIWLAYAYCSLTILLKNCPIPSCQQSISYKSKHVYTTGSRLYPFFLDKGDDYIPGFSI